MGQPYDVGTSQHNGVFPREADQSLSHYASRIQSYCDSGDTFCDSGLDTAVHLTYTVRYNDAAARFALSKIGG